LEDEYLPRYEFKNYDETYEGVPEYIKSYNRIKIRGSICYVSPMEFYQRTLDRTAKPSILRL